MSKVSIVVLTYNKLKEATEPFLLSLLKNTSGGGQVHEIVIVDNGSSDGTVEYLKHFEQTNKNVKLIFNKENLGYSKGCNQAVNASTGEYIVFLNNDILLLPNWLDDLLNIFEKEPDAGLVAVSNIEAFECAQRKFSKLASKKCKKAKKDYEPVILPQFACVMTKKAVFDKIGGFDENFSPAYFEDNDLSWRYIFAGYKNFISKRSYFYHKGSVTGKSLTNLNEIYAKNKKYFFEKYQNKYYVLCDWAMTQQAWHYRDKMLKYKFRNPFYWIKKYI